jgi:hypothetical protein
MKLVFSILLSAWILFSGMGVKIAQHYCEGSLAATKVSLTGELATCGMQGCNEEKSFPVSAYDQLCCENHLSTFLLSNFNTTSTQEVSQPTTEITQVFDIPVTLCNDLSHPGSPCIVSKPPPGSGFLSHTSSSSLCTFRI